MTRGGRVAVVVVLLWSAAAGVQAQAPEVPPDDAYAQPSEGGAEGLTAPAPGQMPPPPPNYAAPTGQPPVPSVYGPQAYDPEAASVAEQREPTDPDRRRGSEMIELYISSSFYTAFAMAWLLSTDGRIDDEEAQYPILAGAIGPLTVLALDLSTGGLPTGVPPSIALGLIGGLVEAGLLSAAFELGRTEEGTFGLITATMSAGAAIGAVGGTQLRPRVTDVRLVASTMMWGLYFTAITAVAIDADFEDASTAMLVGFNLGVVAGMLLTPLNDLSSGKVMLLNAGVAGGALLAYTFTSAFSRGDADAQTAAAAMGVTSAAGLIAMYLLVRPDDPAASEPRSATASVPWVAPTADGSGAVVGVGGVL